jgi:methylenetetrahydrofolate dehydrogenase (NADP+)/methenyltetrahydrofolate cyclohydrolase
MTASLLAGGVVAEAVLAEVAVEAAALADRGITPGLGTILVGDDEGSAGYVRKKHETCTQVGVLAQHIGIPADGTQADLLAAVDRFNRDPAVDGFLIQYPVPAHFDFNAAVLAMDPDKDADGLHPVNLGRLVLQEVGPRPATPAGIQAMLVHYGIETAGRHAVVVGRGPTLGRPLSLILSLREPGANCAVTVVHSAVPDLATYARQADLLVAAVGRPGVIQPEMVKPGAVVISGGITWEGRRLLPDVDEACAEVAGWITPRLGGVGPTTVAMLLRNVVACARRAADR